MHAKRPSIFTFLAASAAIVILAMSIKSVAQEPNRNPEAPPPIPSNGNPEYKIKTLPNDTFKPSEKISEDFPVPFPVDI